eukprot:2565120-Rhodomonas_salina.1
MNHTYYASDPDTSQSVTGFVMSLNNGPVVCKAKRQACVTLSMNTVAYALTKSLPSPKLHKHCEYLWGSRVPFSSHWCMLPDWKQVAVFATVLSDSDPLSGSAVPDLPGCSVTLVGELITPSHCPPRGRAMNCTVWVYCSATGRDAVVNPTCGVEHVRPVGLGTRATWVCPCLLSSGSLPSTHPINPALSLSRHHLSCASEVLVYVRVPVFSRNLRSRRPRRDAV